MDSPKRRRTGLSESGRAVNVLGGAYSDDEGEQQRSGPGQDRVTTAGPAAGKRPKATPKKLTLKTSTKVRSRIIEDHFGYSSESNPFGDANLAAPFVWKKKEQQMRAAGQYSKPTPMRFLEQTQEKITEIESVKKRREERELEETMLEEQKAMLAREKEQENYEEWAIKEEQFHREMAQRRIDIRIEQGRERPVDLLAKAVKLICGEEFDDLTLLEHPPHEIFNDMGAAELDEVIDDIRVHLPGVSAPSIVPPASSDGKSEGPTRSAEAEEMSRRFWRSMMVMAKDALEKSKKLEESEALRVAASAAVSNAAANSLTLAGLPAPSSTLLSVAAATVANSQSLSLVRDEQTGIPLSVSQDIDNLLGSLTVTDLKIMELKMEKKKHEEGQDLTYWEAVQDKLPYYMARAECNEIYQKAKDLVADLRESRRRAQRTEGPSSEATEQAVAAVPEYGHVSNDPWSTAEQQHEDDDDDDELPPPGGAGGEDGEYSPVLEPYEDPEEAAEAAAAAAAVPPPPLTLPGRGSGPYSPMLHPIRDFVHRLYDVVDPVEDRRRRDKLKALLIERERQRHAATVETLNTLRPSTADSTTSSVPSMPTGMDPRDLDVFEKFIRDEGKGGNVDEAPLKSEVSLQRQHFEWEDKYRPRKPRFFNRVKTGYEWNKYNQTHYDHDNPPPKAVQGYKFNIFYPDLIDKTKIPTWTLEPSGSQGDLDEDDEGNTTCLVRFTAGPPYEDVAFKIINRQWELNVRRGYRNCFDRGILQLYFNFTRYRYRR